MNFLIPKRRTIRQLIRITRTVIVFGILAVTVYFPVGAGIGKLPVAFEYTAEAIQGRIAQLTGKDISVQPAHAALDTRIYLTIADGTLSGAQSNGTWTVPLDWNLASNSIEVIGGGGGGGDGTTGVGAGGGGGGGYGKITNLTFAPASTSIPFSVGASGSGGASTVKGGNGGHTWFGKLNFNGANGGCFSAGPTICVSAEGGEGGQGSTAPASLGGIGGNTSSTSGTVEFAGGNGGAGSSTDGQGGGGGAAGPNGIGRIGGAGSSVEGGGGGGSGGLSSTVGQASGLPNASQGGDGGHGYGGTGGGDGAATPANGAAGTAPGAGGGGGDQTTTTTGTLGGNGAAGQQWDSTHGSGGGGGGAGDSGASGGSGGKFGAGGGGGTTCSTAPNCRGGNGLIVITYRPITEITPTAVGTQTASIDIPAATTNTYIGGAFKLTTTSTTTVTSIAVTASTSSGAVTGLDDVKLYWDTAAACDTADPITSATLYNTASANFSALKATISGSTAVTAGTPKCFYPTMDVGTTVTDGLRFDIKIQADTDIVTAITEVGTYPIEITGKTTFNTAAPTIIISGTCLQSDQSTACSDAGANHKIRVAVDGTLKSVVDETVDGSWSIASVPDAATDSIITVFIEGESASSSQAVAVTKYSGAGNIGGIELMQAHVSIGSDQNNTITNANIALYDSSVSSKRTFYDVSGTTLTVDVDTKVLNDELYISAGDVYQPNAAGGDTVTAGHIEIRGTLTANSNSFTASGSWDDNGTFTADTSTLTMMGISQTLDASTFNNLTINPSAAGTITASGSFTVSGTLTMTTGTLSIPSGATITHSGATFTFTAGTISGAGTLKETGSGFTFPTGGTISSILTMDTTNGNQTLSARTYGGAVNIDNSGATNGRTVSLGAGAHTYSSALTILSSGTGSVELTGATNAPAVGVTGDFTFTSGGGTKTLTPGAGTWTMSGSVNLTNGTLTNSVGNTLSMIGTGTLTTASQTLRNVSLAGTSITLANATHTINGNLTLGGTTLTPGSSTIVLSSISASLIGGGKTLNNLTIDPSSAGTITMQTSNLTVSGTLTIAASDKFKIESGRTLTLSSTGTPLSISGTFEPDDGSIVQYSGTSATVTSTTFGGLTLGGTGTYTLPSSGTPTINGNLVITSGATVASGSATILFRAGTTQSITDNNGTKQNLGEIAVQASTSGNTTLTLGSSIKIASATIDVSQTLNANGSNTITISSISNPFTVNGIFKPSTGTIKYTGTTVNITPTKYASISFGGSGTYTGPSSGTTTILGNLAITSGATYASGSSTLFFRKGGSQSITDNNTVKQNLGEIAVQASTSGNTTLTLGGSIKIASATVDASQTLNANGSNTLTITGIGSPLTVPGTFTRSTGTVTFIGPGATNIPGLNYYDLNIQPSADSATHTFLAGTASVSKTFTVGNGTNTGTTITAAANATSLDVASVSISANTTLIANASQEFTVGGHWLNNGSFTHSSGTVTFAFANTASISGATTFNNLTSTAAGKKLKFKPGPTFGIAGTLAITGADGNTVKIESTASGSQWFVNFSGAQSAVTYATIRDSGCAADSAEVTLGTGMVNGGNNGTCWFRVSVTPIGDAGGFPGGGQSGDGSQQGGGGQGAPIGDGSGGGSQQGGGSSGGGGGATPILFDHFWQTLIRF